MPSPQLRRPFLPSPRGGPLCRDGQETLWSESERTPSVREAKRRLSVREAERRPSVHEAKREEARYTRKGEGPLCTRERVTLRAGTEIRPSVPSMRGGPLCRA